MALLDDKNNTITTTKLIITVTIRTTIAAKITFIIPRRITFARSCFWTPNGQNFNTVKTDSYSKLFLAFFWFLSSFTAFHSFIVCLLSVDFLLDLISLFPHLCSYAFCSAVAIIWTVQWQTNKKNKQINEVALITNKNVHRWKKFSLRAQFYCIILWQIRVAFGI